MPYACVVYGCSNRSNREKDRRFFRVPRESVHRTVAVQEILKKRRKKWLTNLSLGLLSHGAESRHARVCSDHFVNGCPSNLHDEENSDWAPTLKLGHEEKKESSCSLRMQRRLQRQGKENALEAANTLLKLSEAENNASSNQILQDTPDQFEDVLDKDEDCNEPHVQVKGATPTSESGVKGSKSLQYDYAQYMCDISFDTGSSSKDCNDFASKTHNDRHLAAQSVRRSYKCMICSKDFKQNSVLKVQSLVYSYEKSFICDICLNAYKLKLNSKSSHAVHSNKTPHVIHVQKNLNTLEKVN